MDYFGNSQLTPDQFRRARVEGRVKCGNCLFATDELRCELRPPTVVWQTPFIHDGPAQETDSVDYVWPETVAVGICAEWMPDADVDLTALRLESGADPNTIPAHELARVNAAQ